MRSTRSTGCSTVATSTRSGWVILKRVSATIRNNARAEQNISLVSADGPCRKNGGGVRSRVPSGIATVVRLLKRKSRPRDARAGLWRMSRSLGGENRTEALHAFERHAATAHHAGQ